MADDPSSPGIETVKKSGYHLLNTDGGMFNDGARKRDDPPGEAAVAFVLSKIKSGKEVIVEGVAGSIGPCTNDLAEYRALIEGLTFAIAEGIQYIRVYVDSEFVVEQVNGRAKVVEEDLVPYLEEVKRLINRFAPKVGCRISWVPRERNKLADELVRTILYD